MNYRELNQAERNYMSLPETYEQLYYETINALQREKEEKQTLEIDLKLLQLEIDTLRAELKLTEDALEEANENSV